MAIRLVFPAFIVAVWLLVGTIIYFNSDNCSVIPRLQADGSVTDITQCPWTFAQSFYFSVQTGMSIGFGLLSESQDTSKLYSCFHILAGSSFIGGALALFAELALTRQMDFMSAEEKRLAKASAALHADGYDGLDLEQLRDLMVRYPQYSRAVILKVEDNPAVAEEKYEQFKAADHNQRKMLATTLLMSASEKVDEFKNGTMTIQDLEALDAAAASPMTRMQRTLRANRNFLVSQTAFLTWIVIGVLFSVYMDQNNFVDGLYFAVSTLSTAGMVAVKTVDDQSHVLFAAFFALTGVPIYCAYLGSFAGLLVDSFRAKQTEQALDAKLTAAEMEFLGHLAKAGNEDDVDLSEFVTFQLLRLGAVDRDLVASIRQQFDKLDKNGDGKVKLSAFVHSAEVSRSRNMIQVKM